MAGKDLAEKVAFVECCDFIKDFGCIDIQIDSKSCLCIVAYEASLQNKGKLKWHRM